MTDTMRPVVGVLFILSLLFAACSFADITTPHLESNVLTCQEPSGKLFFIFKNDNILIQQHVGRQITCVTVLDTEGAEHQFCDAVPSPIKCVPTLGYQL